MCEELTKAASGLRPGELHLDYASRSLSEPVLAKTQAAEPALRQSVKQEVTYTVY